jgi:hypothetical protein
MADHYRAVARQTGKPLPEPPPMPPAGAATPSTHGCG